MDTIRDPFSALERHVDQRHKSFLETGEFFQLYHAEIAGIFSILGLELPDDPSEIRCIAEQKLIGRDHGEAVEKVQFNEEQAIEMRPYFEAMGLCDAYIPPPGHYDMVVILGGTAAAIEARIVWLRVAGITADRYAILAGERPVDGRDKPESNFAPNPNDDAWTRWRTEKGWEQANESAVARYYLQQFGKTSLSAVGWSAPPDDANRYPQDYYFKVDAGADGERCQQEVVIVHGRAVQRSLGPSRPTTDSTIRELIDRHIPERNADGKPIEMIVASAGVHTKRITQEARDILIAKCRGDVIVVPAGAAPDPANTPCQLARMALDESGRMICRAPSISQLQTV